MNILDLSRNELLRLPEPVNLDLAFFRLAHIAHEFRLHWLKKPSFIHVDNPSINTNPRSPFDHFIRRLSLSNLARFFQPRILRAKCMNSRTRENLFVFNETNWFRLRGMDDFEFK